MLGQEASLFSKCLLQPLFKEQDLKKSHVYPHTSDFTRKHLSISLHQLAVRPIFLSRCVLPHQVNSVCWASLNHLDSHILYLLADEEVWWAGHALTWKGICGFVKWHPSGQRSGPLCTYSHPFRKSSARGWQTGIPMLPREVAEVPG